MKRKKIVPVEIEKPVIGQETPIHRMFREMMEELGIKIYSPNQF